MYRADKKAYCKPFFPTTDKAISLSENFLINKKLIIVPDSNKIYIFNNQTCPLESTPVKNDVNKNTDNNGNK